MSGEEADSSLPGFLLRTCISLNNFMLQRIVEIKSLVTETENAVLTSSIDRSIKVWNLDYIFEKEHHIDKHELTIDSLSISTSAQLAVVVTRSCIGRQSALF